MQLTGLHFDNQTLRVLPLEKVPDNPRLVEPVRQVKGACFSPIKPEPVRAPKLVVASRSCLKLLGLGPEQVFAFRYGCIPAQCSFQGIVHETLVMHRPKMPTLSSILVEIRSCQDHRQLRIVTAVISLAISVDSWVMVQRFT